MTDPPPRPEDDVDITDCEREPIHVPGSVQPHGVLLALREPELVVTHASANAGGLSAAGAAAPMAGADLRALLSGPAYEAVRAGLTRCDGGPHPCLIATVAGSTGAGLDVLAHRHAGRLILEFEPAPEAGRGGGHGVIDALASEAAVLERAASLDELCAATADAVRRLTGFDKVMVYRFDDDWNGTVLAEAGPPDMDAYLGLRFPASDIPPQARELYRLNPVRLIPDVGYAPVPLAGDPRATPAPPPLDLTYAVLRSVSPVHVEYLRNMGVAASMSISVVGGGRLWGLVACHHRAPRFVPHAVRSACTVLARLVAPLASAIETGREAAYAAAVRTVHGRLLAHLAAAEHVADALGGRGDDLLRLVDAAGAAVCVDGECRLFGATPGPADVGGIVRWLATAGRPPLFHTDWLPGVYPEAGRFRDRAAGVIVATLSGVRRDYVLWFRPELVQTVRWAGNPAKAVGGGAVADAPATATTSAGPPPPPPPRLHPRASFAAWEERVGQRSRPWRPAELEVAGSLREALVDATLRRAEEAAARAKESEARFRAWADAAPVLIWVSGPDKGGTFFNRPWLEFAGRPLEQELGDGWADRIHPDDAARCMRTCAEAFEARRPFTMEFRLRNAAGEYRWIMDHGVPRHDAAGAFLGYVGSCVDVTERNLAEADARQQRAALTHVARVVALGELTAAIAHELRQPLTAILTNAQATRQFLAAPPSPPDLAEARGALVDIASDARRAADVIDRLSRLLVSDGGRVAAAAPVDLNAVIRTVERLLSGEARARHVEVRVELAPDLPPTSGDEVELQQVILNLMMNAFAAMDRTPPGSRLLVLRTLVVDGGEGGGIGGAHVQAQVQDHGVGIPPGELERIFEPFVTTKPGGLGMGLSICRSIIKRHGGTLRAASNAEGDGNGAGALVSLTLPVAAPSPEPK